MAVIHANQPGAVHNIERGTITDADISDNAAIQARKIQNFSSVAVASHLNLTDVTGDQHHARSHDHSVAADGTLAFGSPGASAIGDTVAAGTATTPARSDHRHSRETFGTNAIVLGTAAAAGIATTYNRSDDTIAAFDVTAPTTSALADAAATGSVAFAARRDHRHGRESFATNAVLLGTAAAAGAATTPMRSNDTIAAFDATVPTTAASGDAAATGSVAFAARRDHRHGMPAISSGVPLVTTFTANGTWTRAAGTTYVRVIAIGGGGGGGGATAGAAASAGAGGGGAGGYSERWMTATTAGSSQTVTIGAAGAGGASSGGNGGNGGNTTFGTLLTANGGTGATGVSGTNTLGGAGGTAATGDINITGQGGDAGYTVTGGDQRAIGGAGGSMLPYAVGGAGTTINAGTQGTAGKVGVNGGGGSGACVNNASSAGGAGGAGFVFVLEMS